MDERGVGLLGTLLEQRYRVDALLARGGMSSVYRGLDTRLDRRVAIKVMDERFADDRTFVDRFEREARSAAKIHHPNVVAVHDQGVDRSVHGDLIYLVMELVDGGTLRDLISERVRLDVPTSLAIMESVLGALTAAHRAGLVHRDVKPENVLIGHGGEAGSTVKVGDFGLVRAIHSAGTTSASVILGTVAYLSPEQVTTGNATERGDVYAAGIVLFEMLTGVAPYTGDNAISVAYRHVNDDVPAPSTLVGGIPAELDELVVRATRRDAAVRPADGAEFLSELQRLRVLLGTQRLPVPVPAPTVADRTVPVSPIDHAAAFATPPTGPDTGPHPAPNIASGGLDLAELDPERTATLAPAVPVAPVMANATIVRPVPGGFRPMGPQGTRAMMRTDLERASTAATEFVPPTHTPTSGPFAAQRPPRGPRNAPPAPPPAPKSRTGQIVLWSVIGVLVLALVGTTTWWFTSGRYRTVPGVSGLALADAQQSLVDNDLKPKVEHVFDNKVPRGKVVRTDPAKDQEMLRGDPVTVFVSDGRPVVPDVSRGADQADAAKQIKDNGLVPGTDDGQNRYADDIKKGQVLELSPGAGTELDLGERVIMVLSKGPEPKPVPDVRNKTHDEAFQELQRNGYTPKDAPAPEFSPDVDAGRVIRTDPEAGKKIEGDTKDVTVFVSNAVTVPDVGNKSLDEARQILTGLGLQIEEQGFPGGGSRTVFGQQPAAGSRVEPNSKVIIYVF